MIKQNKQAKGLEFLCNTKSHSRGCHNQQSHLHYRDHI